MQLHRNEFHISHHVYRLWAEMCCQICVQSKVQARWPQIHTTDTNEVKKKKKKRKEKAEKKQLDRNEFHIMSTDFGQICVKSKVQTSETAWVIHQKPEPHTYIHTHTNQKKKKKRKENPEQKQQNKLVWPNIRCGACNRGEQDTLTLCTPSPSNCYSQN